MLAIGFATISVLLIAIFEYQTGSISQESLELQEQRMLQVEFTNYLSKFNKNYPELKAYNERLKLFE